MSLAPSSRRWLIHLFFFSISFWFAFCNFLVGGYSRSTTDGKHVLEAIVPAVDHVSNNSVFYVQR